MNETEHDDRINRYMLIGILGFFVLLMSGWAFIAIDTHEQRFHCERLHLAYVDGDCHNISTERPSN